MRLRAPPRRRCEHIDIAAGSFRRVEWLVVEIVAHKGDHIVCRAGIEQFQRQRQIGREGAAAQASSGLPSPVTKPISA
jgi:hypothetical protein